MSVFGMIKDAIFGAVGSAQAQAPQGAQPGAGQGNAMPQFGAGQAAPGQQVDVEQVLSQRASAKGNPDLNWRSSIVDLMKLLDLDSSLDNRKALATELGYTGAKDGSAEMNIWLHRRVMQELERNGGLVPAAMKD
jgi:hypothetical protein